VYPDHPWKNSGESALTLVALLPVAWRRNVLLRLPLHSTC